MQVCPATKLPYVQVPTELSAFSYPRLLYAGTVDKVSLQTGVKHKRALLVSYLKLVVVEPEGEIKKYMSFYSLAKIFWKRVLQQDGAETLQVLLLFEGDSDLLLVFKGTTTETGGECGLRFISVISDIRKTQQELGSLDRCSPKEGDTGHAQWHEADEIAPRESIRNKASEPYKIVRSKADRGTSSSPKRINDISPQIANESFGSAEKVSLVSLGSLRVPSPLPSESPETPVPHPFRGRRVSYSSSPSPGSIKQVRLQDQSPQGATFSLPVQTSDIASSYTEVCESSDSESDHGIDYGTFTPSQFSPLPDNQLESNTQPNPQTDLQINVVYKQLISPRFDGGSLAFQPVQDTGIVSVPSQLSPQTKFPHNSDKRSPNTYSNHNGVSDGNTYNNNNNEVSSIKYPTLDSNIVVGSQIFVTEPATEFQSTLGFQRVCGSEGKLIKNTNKSLQSSDYPTTLIQEQLSPVASENEVISNRNIQQSEDFSTPPNRQRFQREGDNYEMSLISKSLQESPQKVLPTNGLPLSSNTFPSNVVETATRDVEIADLRKALRKYESEVAFLLEKNAVLSMELQQRDRECERLQSQVSQEEEVVNTHKEIIKDQKIGTNCNIVLLSNLAVGGTRMVRCEDTCLPKTESDVSYLVEVEPGVIRLPEVELDNSCVSASQSSASFPAAIYISAATSPASPLLSSAMLQSVGREYQEQVKDFIIECSDTLKHLRTDEKDSREMISKLKTTCELVTQQAETIAAISSVHPIGLKEVTERAFRRQLSAVGLSDYQISSLNVRLAVRSSEHLASVTFTELSSILGFNTTRVILGAFGYREGDTASGCCYQINSPSSPSRRLMSMPVFA